MIVGWGYDVYMVERRMQGSSIYGKKLRDIKLYCF